MFEKFSPDDRARIYRALKDLVENNTGVSFHNGDQGHFRYTSAAQGNPTADSTTESKSNQLFRMLCELTSHVNTDGNAHYDWFTDFSDWQTFCSFAVTSNKPHKRASAPMS